jgi:hypothetical protein
MERILEANAAEGMAFGLVQHYAKPRKRLTRVRHQSLAAGLVDRGCAGLDHGAIDPTLAKGDGGGKPGGAPSDDQGIGGRGRREKRIGRFGWVAAKFMQKQGSLSLTFGD